MANCSGVPSTVFAKARRIFSAEPSTPRLHSSNKFKLFLTKSSVIFSPKTSLATEVKFVKAS
jgi:hypothetical protein